MDIGIRGLRVAANNEMFGRATPKIANLSGLEDLSNPAMTLHPPEYGEQFLTIVNNPYGLACLNPSENLLRNLSEHPRAEGALAHRENDFTDGCAFAQIQTFKRFQF
jgi:hypothetical protein